MTDNDPSKAREDVAAARRAELQRRQQEAQRRQEQQRSEPAQKSVEAEQKKRESQEPEKISDREVKASGSKLTYRSGAVPKVKDGVEVLSDQVKEGETLASEYEGEYKTQGRETRREESVEDDKPQSRSSSTAKLNKDGVLVLGDRVREGEKTFRPGDE